MYASSTSVSVTFLTDVTKMPKEMHLADSLSVSAMEKGWQRSWTVAQIISKNQKIESIHFLLSYQPKNLSHKIAMHI